MDKQLALRALYIMHDRKRAFNDILAEGDFVFVDARSSLEFLSFLNTYLVRDNGK